jgi:hypothetical protein
MFMAIHSGEEGNFVTEKEISGLLNKSLDIIDNIGKYSGNMVNFVDAILNNAAETLDKLDRALQNNQLYDDNSVNVLLDLMQEMVDKAVALELLLQDSNPMLKGIRIDLLQNPNYRDDTLCTLALEYAQFGKSDKSLVILQEVMRESTLKSRYKAACLVLYRVYNQDNVNIEIEKELRLSAEAIVTFVASLQEEEVISKDISLEDHKCAQEIRNRIFSDELVK